MHVELRLALSRTLRSVCVAAIVVVALICIGGAARGEDALVQLNLTRLAKMDDNERSAIAQSNVRFEGFSPTERDRLQTLEEELRQDKNQAELRRVMGRYNEWLATLSKGQQMDLGSIIKPDDRIKRIREMMAADLPEEDRHVVGKWIHEYAEDKSDELLEIARENRLWPRPQMMDALRHLAGSKQAMFVVWRAAEAGKESLLPFDELDFRVLESRLSPEPAERLSECISVDMKKMVLAKWMKTMALDFDKRMKMFGARADAGKDYPSLLKGLGRDEKYEIFSLSPDEARQRLAEEWSSQHDDFPFGGPGLFGPPPPGGPPPGDRDGGRRGGRRNRDGDHDDDERGGRDRDKEQLPEKETGKSQPGDESNTK